MHIQEQIDTLTTKITANQQREQVIDQYEGNLMMQVQACFRDVYADIDEEGRQCSLRLSQPYKPITKLQNVEFP